MATSNRHIPACLLLAAAATCAAVASSRICGPTERIQRALEELGSGRDRDAERIAMTIAEGEPPCPRAWLIVATARQRSGAYASAIRAYRLFLASSESGDQRSYVTGQIRICEEAMDKPPAANAPSRRLSQEDLAGLAKVEEGFSTESTEHFVVRARNPRLARLVAAEAERALTRICGGILGGQDYAHTVEINVWPDHKEFTQNVVDVPDYAGGNFSFTTKDDVTTRRVDLTQRDDQGRFSTLMLDRILPHEMCHLILREFFGDTACPLFLNEGLAMLAESEVDNDRVVLAGTALSGKGKIPLENLMLLERQVLKDPALFYAESYAFLAFLRSRLSDSQFKSMLENVKSGCSVVDAVQRALCSPDDEDFLQALSRAWEEEAISQAQFIRTLRGGP
jgi:hypothetical protein